MRVPIAFFLLVFLHTHHANGNGKCSFAEWKPVEFGVGENPPVLTSAGHCFSQDGIAWIFGGRQYSKVSHHNDISDQLWSYNIKTHSWRLHQKRSVINWPISRHNSKLCCGQNHLVLYGGVMSSSVYLQDLWIFDIVTGLWFLVSFPTSEDSEHIRLLNSGSVTSWCWNEALWYVHNTETQSSVTYFSRGEMQWISENINNRTLDSVLGRGEVNPIVIKSSVWFFKITNFNTGKYTDETQVDALSMDSLQWALHSFKLERHCSSSLENESETFDFQNASIKHSFLYGENETILLARTNYLSEIWTFDIEAKKLRLSKACDNIFEYEMSMESCVLENSSRWFVDSVWYSHGGVLLCKNEVVYHMDQVWTVELSFTDVCSVWNTVSPGVIFMLIFFSILSLAIVILCSIVLRKCVNGPYLKPPVHYGKAIRYSQLALEEIT